MRRSLRRKFFRPEGQAWSSQLFDLRGPSSTDVPVLLLNQPNVHCGNDSGYEFAAMLEFAPQNSPTMHFDNYLDPVSRATSKWWIVYTTAIPVLYVVGELYNWYLCSSFIYRFIFKRFPHIFHSIDEIKAGNASVRAALIPVDFRSFSQNTLSYAGGSFSTARKYFIRSCNFSGTFYLTVHFESRKANLRNSHHSHPFKAEMAF